ncbi:D-alanine--D-alanine ligase, partial [Brucella abortus]
VFLVREGANRPVAEVGADDWAYGDPVMVAPFIAGKELAVTVLGEETGPRALTITDITPTKGFYDYEAKYAEGGSKHVLPADLP